MIWLAVAALVAGCAYLQRRHNRRLARLDQRHVRTIRLPSGIVEFRKPLTPAEARAFKQAWLKSYAELTKVEVAP